MAIGMTYNRRQEDLNRQQGKVGSAYPYQGLQGVSENTANNLGNYQGGYTAGEQVQKAQQNLDDIQAQKPQGYNSKYAPQLDNILNQIQNPEKFKYEFNGDEMFKYYADLYTQKARQMSKDTQGQAAALPGGYGNSWGQQAGAQAYQQAILQLYDKGMELQNAAYQRYRDDIGDVQNQYNYLRDADTNDYGRYQDQLALWQNERDYAAGRADAERNMDLNTYNTDRDYWTGLAQAENAAYGNDLDRAEAIRQYEQNFAENQRQYDQNFAENQRQYDQDFGEAQRKYDQGLAQEYAMAILNNGQMPTMDLLNAAGLSYEDALKLLKQLQSGGGSGRGSGDDKEKKISPEDYSHELQHMWNNDNPVARLFNDQRYGSAYDIPKNKRYKLD